MINELKEHIFYESSIIQGQVVIRAKKGSFYLHLKRELLETIKEESSSLGLIILRKDTQASMIDGLYNH